MATGGGRLDRPPAFVLAEHVVEIDLGDPCE